MSPRWRLLLPGALVVAGAIGVGELATQHWPGAHAAVPHPALALTGRVVDTAKVLDATQRTALEARLARLEREAGPQMVVATTTSLNGQPIAAYSITLARSWGLGDAHRNDGVLLLVAPVEHQVRIEVGKGLEATLSNAFCQQIIDQAMLPFYRRGDIAGGTIAGADALIAALTAHPTLAVPRKAA